MNQLNSDDSDCRPAATERFAPVIGRYQEALAWIVMALFIGALAALAASRDYLGFGTETDFLGGFMGDAQRFMRQEPLKLAYHPPFYSITLAVVQGIVDDWFVTGRLVSVVAAGIALVVNFHLFRAVMSSAAGWGTIVAAALSPAFILYTVYASSDLFFLALYSGTIWLAYLAERRNSVSWWFAVGIVLGCALLTRTNALTLVLVALVPWLAPGLAVRRKLILFAMLMAGLVASMGLWATYAKLTDSNIFPVEGTATNLALAYYMPEGITREGDALPILRDQFSSTWEVLTKDPAHIARSYIKDLLDKSVLILSSRESVLAFPVVCLILAALLSAFFFRQSRWLVYISTLALAQFMLLNFKSYEVRFFLFLVPLFGALIGECAYRLYRHRARADNHPLAVAAGYAALGLVLALSFALAVRGGIWMAHRDQPELRESVPLARAIIEPGSVLLARKPPLAFYTGARRATLPVGDGIADVLEIAWRLSSEHRTQVYVYYGQAELKYRPEYSALADPAKLEEDYPELEVAARSKTGRWVLYRLADAATE